MFHRAASLALVVASMLLLSSSSSSLVHADIFDTTMNWTRVQHFRDSGMGQSWYNFSDSVDLQYPFLAVGTTTAFNGKGLVRVYHTTGSGFELVATLKDPAARYGQGFGSHVYFFERVGFLHLAVTAKTKGGSLGDGAVLVFRNRASSGPHDWFLTETIYPPANESVTNFGRITRFDGDVLIISSESRYQYSNRFVIASINVPGTRDFIESSGIGPLPSDPVFAYRSLNGRDNSTAFALVQTLRAGPYTYNYGHSLDEDKGNLTIGASFRTEMLFGFGTDGDLVVDSGVVYLLDGTAEYNFNSITIMPGGVLTTDGYDPLRRAGGVMRINIKDKLYIHPNGTVNMTVKGYKGGATRFSYTQSENGDGPGGGLSAVSPFVGDLSCQYDGTDVLTASLAVDFAALTLRNDSLNASFAEPCGGGGSYATLGTEGTLVQCGSSGTPGPVYGQSELLNEIHYGSGGGAGQPWKVGSGGAGGNGGGQIIINARTIENFGTVEANGGPGEDGSFFSGGGGGGSGGSILLRGASFTNEGLISAKGGAGGYRSVDSGNGIGDGSVRGGNGGQGRIRIDYLTKFPSSTGVMDPAPNNVTLWDGAVYWYKKQPMADGGLYQLVTELPRAAGMQFIGHSVAIKDSKVAIASDERSLNDPRNSIYLVDITGVVNTSSAFAQTRELLPPNPAVDRGYGHGAMHWADDNGTSLLVKANGRNLTRGVLYVYSSKDFWSPAAPSSEERVDTIESVVDAGSPTTVNEFGQGATYNYPYILARVPTSNDETYTRADRESFGTVVLLRYMDAVDPAQSTVDCEYASATANTTLTCFIRARDALGRATGDHHNTRDFDWPNTTITYVRDGVFSFTHMATNLSVDTVYATFKGTPLGASFSLAVTEEIDPMFTNFTCTPYQVVPGQSITCWVRTPHGRGEPSAAKDFDVVVYNTQDVELQVQASDVSTPFGVFRPPRSKYISTDPLHFDFPTVSPVTQWERQGVFRFTFVPWRPGPYAAFAKYKNAALRFPNPQIVDALQPPVDAKDSVVRCPKVWAPNRTIACTFQMTGANGGGDGGGPELVANFTRRVHATAFVNGVPQSVTPVWAGEGRISLLAFPAENGNLTFQVKYKDTFVAMDPPEGVIISPSFATNCQRASLVLQSYVLHNQVAKGYTDEAVWGQFVQKVQYIAGTGFCDTPTL